MRLRLLAVALVAATSVLLPVPAEATDFVDFPDVANTVTDIGSAVAKSDVHLAQTFTAGATASLTRVQLDLRHDAGYAGDALAYLNVYATDGSGVPTGSTLGQAQANATQVTTSQAMVAFTGFSLPINLIAGTKYALVLSTNGTDGPHSVTWFHSGDNGYAAGSAFTGPAPWTGNAGIDRRFATFVSFHNSFPVCNDVGPVATAVNTPVTIPFSCTDAETWQQLRYIRNSNPLHGTVSPASGPAGTLVYTPAAGYTGPDSFTYRGDDRYELSSARTVTLNVGQSTTPPPGTTPGTSPGAAPTVAVTGKPAIDSKKGTAKLTIAVSGPGTVTISGKGLKTATATATAAGTLTLTVKPDAKTKKTLKDKHKATVTVTVTVTPTGSSTPSSTVTQKVKLKKKG